MKSSKMNKGRNASKKVGNHWIRTYLRHSLDLIYFYGLLNLLIESYMSVIVREVSKIGKSLLGEYHCLYIVMHSY